MYSGAFKTLHNVEDIVKSPTVKLDAVNLVDKEGQTALLLAAASEQWETIERR